MLKEQLDLDGLVHFHTKKRKRAKHYSRQATMILAVICLVFFGSIIALDTGINNVNMITGMVVYVGNSAAAESASSGMSNIVGFVTAVKASPRVTEYKLFFYTMWIFVVLIGSAIYYEYKRK
jgi:hypothetical protein